MFIRAQMVLDADPVRVWSLEYPVTTKELTRNLISMVSVSDQLNMGFINWLKNILITLITSKKLLFNHLEIERVFLLLFYHTVMSHNFSLT